ncbi:hypothetical protein EDD16DRAFT_1621430 [Pisolithus croceorrhizus]|nr:hypothetical protein EDD16DRAFT_1621430 [Pisolithus croceorrhizus]
MPPHVAALVVVAVASVAATAAFYQFVYEPHIAPAIEAWAEDFIARRRATRNARAVPISTSQRPQRSHSSSSSSSPSSSTRGADGSPRDDPSATCTRRATRRTTRTRGRTALVANDVEEWRNNVRRSQRESGLRRRRGLGLGGRMHSASDHDLDHMSTTLDESITELTHTPITPTHVISNVSSPVSSDGLSISSAPHSPTRAHLSIRNRSSSTTTAIATAVQDREPHTSQPSQRHFTIPPSPPLTPVPPSSLTSPRLITIPSIGRSSNYTTIDRDEDSPFGPLLPDTPRSSPALYAGRPFSPIVRLAGHPLLQGFLHLDIGTSALKIIGTMDSVGSFLSADNVQLGHDHMPIHNPIHSPSCNLSPGCQALGAIGHPLESDYIVPDSSIASLSLRYPAPPTSPVLVSPPPSEGARSLSSPSFQNSMFPPSSEELRSLSSFSSPEWVTLPVSVIPELVIPPTSASASPESVLFPGLASSPVPVPPSSRPEPASGITGLSLSASTLRIPQPSVASLRPNSGGSPLIPSSPTTSYASFATPASAVRSVSSVSDVGDIDFLSAADHDDENDDEGRILNMASHVPLSDRAYNPFLDYEEVFEVGSDESDDNDHGSDGSGSDGSWGTHGSAELH